MSGDKNGMEVWLVSNVDDSRLIATCKYLYWYPYRGADIFCRTPPKSNIMHKGYIMHIYLPLMIRGAASRGRHRHLPKEIKM